MIVLALLFACGTATEPAPAPTPAADVLAAADAHDGAVDHVVHECASCSLGMDGDAAHASQHGGYTLHFCSASCKDRFEADPESAIDRLAKAVD